VFSSLDREENSTMQSTVARDVSVAPKTAERKIVKRKEKKDWRAGLWALFFLGPNLVLFLLFTAYPVAYGFYLSFFKYSVLKPAKYIGLQNYRTFFSDPLTGTLLKNSIIFALGTVIPLLVLPLLIAVLLNNAGRLTGLWRAIYFIPLVTSAVAAAAVWKWLYARDFGLINFGLRKIGGQPVDWLFNLDWAMPAVIVMTIWLLLPFNIILYTAGLQEIPGTITKRHRLMALPRSGSSSISPYPSLRLQPFSC